MPWYYRAKAAINAAVPFLVPTQKTNLALLVSAILKKRKTRTLSASPSSLELTRRPKTAGGRPQALLAASAQKALALHQQRASRRPGGATRFRGAHHCPILGYPPVSAVVVMDWTMFDANIPSGGEKIRYQVLRVAVPRKGQGTGSQCLASSRSPSRPRQNVPSHGSSVYQAPLSCHPGNQTLRPGPAPVAN
jgi:hypothetical protein